MASWASSSPRTFMNDANRSRFSNVQPCTENLKDSVGPCAYNPNKLAFRTTTPGRGRLVAFIPPRDGIPERQRDIYGIPVSKILPINASTYSPRGPKQSPFDRINEEGIKPQFSFVSSTHRQLWPKTDINAHPEVYPPGPVQYGLPDISPCRPRSPVAIIDTREARECNSPVQKDPLPTLTSSKMSVYASSTRSGSPMSLSGHHHQNNMTPMNSSRARIPAPPGGETSSRSRVGTASSQRSPNQQGESSPLPHTPGGLIGSSPRHFNINNINSLVKREHDPDFDNPAPGQYDVVRSPRRRL